MSEPSRLEMFVEDIVFPENGPIGPKVIENNIGVFNMGGPVLRGEILE
jgi:hypothetical protein